MNEWMNEWPILLPCMLKTAVHSLWIYLFLRTSGSEVADLVRGKYGEQFYFSGKQSYIRQFSFLYLITLPSTIIVLYGGSVTPETIDDLMKCPDIDGALVGTWHDMTLQMFLSLIPSSMTIISDPFRRSECGLIQRSTWSWPVLHLSFMDKVSLMHMATFPGWVAFCH